MGYTGWVLTRRDGWVRVVDAADFGQCSYKLACIRTLNLKDVVPEGRLPRISPTMLALAKRALAAQQNFTEDVETWANRIARDVADLVD